MARGRSTVESTEKMTTPASERPPVEAALGVIQSWMVIGPFDNERGTGFARAYPPERAIDPGASVPGKRRAVRWRTIPVDHSPYGTVDLNSLMRPNDQCLAYALTYLKVETPTPVALRFGSDEIGRAHV